MTSRILCGSERDRGLTGPWWNINKEGLESRPKPDHMIQVLRVQVDFRNWRVILLLFNPSAPFPKGKGEEVFNLGKCKVQGSGIGNVTVKREM